MHEAIVRYYVFTVEPVLQRPYLAMEFVDGRSLSDILHDDGPLPFEAVRSLMQRVACRPAGGARARHHPSRRVARQHHRAGRRRRARQDHRFRHRALDRAQRRHRDRQRLCRQVQLRLARAARPVRRRRHGEVRHLQPRPGAGAGADRARRSTWAARQVQIVEKRRKVPDLGAIDMRFRPLLEKMLQPRPGPSGRNRWRRSRTGSSVPRASCAT